jgi:type I restriction enzyme, S subunit
VNNWKKTTLGKYISIKHGFAFKGEYFTEEENQNILLTPGNFHVGGGFKGDKFKYYTGDFPSDYILKENDLVVTMTDLSKDGDTLGFPAKVPCSADNRFLHNQRIGLVEFLNDDFFKDYLYYLMCTKEYQRTIVNGASGSTVRHTSPTKIKEYEFLLPPFPEQKAIAAILSSFDDKIELLGRQNKTLESMAQGIFKEWFIKFKVNGKKQKVNSSTGLPEGWRMGKLGDEFEIIMGQSPDGASYNESGEGMIFFQGRAEFQERFPTTRLYTTEPKRIAEKFDVLVSVRAPVGDINVAFDKCCIGRGLAAVRSEYKSYALYKIKSLKDAFGKFEDEGTVFGSIGKDSFANIETILPDGETVKAFEAIAGSIDAKIYNNYKQIQTLSKLRDALLPKLMKGEIRVKKAQAIA